MILTHEVPNIHRRTKHCQDCTGVEASNMAKYVHEQHTLDSFTLIQYSRHSHGYWKLRKDVRVFTSLA